MEEEGPGHYPPFQDVVVTVAIISGSGGIGDVGCQRGGGRRVRRGREQCDACHRTGGGGSELHILL